MLFFHTEKSSVQDNKHYDIQTSKELKEYFQNELDNNSSIINEVFNLKLYNLSYKELDKLKNILINNMDLENDTYRLCNEDVIINDYMNTGAYDYNKYLIHNFIKNKDFDCMYFYDVHNNQYSVVNNAIIFLLLYNYFLENS